MKQTPLTPALYDYMLDVSLREHPVLTALRTETANMALAVMQIPPEQAQFMQFLLHVLQAKRVLEVGTFTGYSALAMALALPDDGRVITCDISPEWTKVARPFWEKAQQSHKIDLRLAPALQTLNQLIKDDLAHTFDFIFIDADKTNYINYYELALQLIRPRGIIAIDNVFWGGKILDQNQIRGQTREIRRLNEHIKNDTRVTVSLLPIADGLLLIHPQAIQLNQQ